MLDSTREDVRRFLTGGLRPHTCDHCGNTLLVKKNSLPHTSVQWLDNPASSCPEFATAEGPGALVPTCAKLRASIERAVLDGSIEVGRP